MAGIGAARGGLALAAFLAAWIIADAIGSSLTGSAALLLCSREANAAT
jgi:hypothetical protein